MTRNGDARPFMTALDAETRTLLEALAQRSDRSMSSVIRSLIRAAGNPAPAAEGPLALDPEQVDLLLEALDEARDRRRERWKREEAEAEAALKAQQREWWQVCKFYHANPEDCTEWCTKPRTLPPLNSPDFYAANPDLEPRSLLRQRFEESKRPKRPQGA